MSKDATDDKVELSKLEIKEMKTWFEMFDKDKDKQLDKDEVKGVFTAKCWNDKFTDEEFNAIFKKADKDGNGRLDFDEYVTLLELFKKDPHQEKMDMQRDLRAISDCPKKETIAKRHIREFLAEFNVENLEEIMQQADREGNGKINIIAFLDLLLE